MGWLVKVKPDHECRKPTSPSLKFGVGSTWKCRRCGAVWGLTENRHLPDRYGRSYMVRHRWNWQLIRDDITKEDDRG